MTRRGRGASASARRGSSSEVAERTAEPGVATGLAWTPVGGDILFIEATQMPGKGKLMLTGQLGDVMKESAQAALSCVRSHAEQLGIDPTGLRETRHPRPRPGRRDPEGRPVGGRHDVHGARLAVHRRARASDVAMTGEITLPGLVLPSAASRRRCSPRTGPASSGDPPARNEADLDDVPPGRDEMEFVFVDSMDEVLDAAFDGTVVTHARRPAGTERQAAATRRA